MGVWVGLGFGLSMVFLSGGFVSFGLVVVLYFVLFCFWFCWFVFGGMFFGFGWVGCFALWW